MMDTIGRPKAVTATTGSSPAETSDPAARPVLRGEALVRRFGLTEALRGIDVSIAEGEIVAVMGPSGSGKSTLLHCLAGILRPDSGRVLFEDRRIDDLGEAARSRLRRGTFGFVFQFGQLVPELPAVENVALPLLLGGAPRNRAMAAAAAMFPRLGLDGLEGRRPGEMSGGQAQRVAVARALVTEPRVVFADEPTGSLDSLAGEQVMELLTAAARAARMTVVLVTHEPRIAAYADRELVVRDGRVSDGTAG
jgi:putative ABC transport system ATP-binding protein